MALNYAMTRSVFALFSIFRPMLTNDVNSALVSMGLFLRSMHYAFLGLTTSHARANSVYPPI